MSVDCSLGCNLDCSADFVVPEAADCTADFAGFVGYMVAADKFAVLVSDFEMMVFGRTVQRLVVVVTDDFDMADVVLVLQEVERRHCSHHP